MTQVRIREVIATMRVTDSESLLSPEVMERIVSAVLLAMRQDQRDEASRKQDVRIGACCSGCGDGGSGGSS